MSLDEFASREKCWTCALPPEIREEIDRTRRESARKIGPDTVIHWLVAEKGYDRRDIKRGSINYHFQQRHHEQ